MYLKFLSGSLCRYREYRTFPAYGPSRGETLSRRAAAPTHASWGGSAMNAPAAEARALGDPSARTRVPWFASVRTRLVLITLVPMAGLAILTGMQARSSWSVVADAGRAHALADASTSTMELLHQLGSEQAEAVSLRDRGGVAGQFLVTAQRARTDDALAAFWHTSAAAVAVAPGLRPTLDAATGQLEQLTLLRNLASPGLDAVSTPPPSAAVDVQGLYAPVTEALLAVADAVPAQLVDRELANRTRAIAALATAKHALAIERDVLSTVFRRHSYVQGDFARLVTFATIEREGLETFDRVAGPGARARFQLLFTGPDVQAATALRDAALSGATNALAVDSDAWYVAASHTIRLLHQVELGLAGELSIIAVQSRNAALRDASITIVGAVSLAITSVVIAIVVATSTSRRLSRLRRTALTSATRLPVVVGEITRAADPMLAHDTQLSSANGPDAQTLSRRSRDEIGQVASAFSTVHATALRLAADQALMRLDTEALVTALARRSQKLIQRQLGAIDDLERSETDPDTLATYYVIDHLAARMRRNAENLLVLTGAEPGRRFSGAFPLLDVVRAAAAEIADYRRIDIESLPNVYVAGRSVGDLAHLLAELLENAASYSPPQTRVTVTGRRTVAGVVVSVYDCGIGMPPHALAAANERLRQPTILTSALAGALGLPVVARLATRHDVVVELRSHDGRGTAALVGIPNQVLAEPVDTVRAPAEAARQRSDRGGVGTSFGPSRGDISEAARRALTMVDSAPVIYEQMLSAWFVTRGGRGGGHASPADGFVAPGDRERAVVERLAAAQRSHVDGAALPRRPPGANLMPGQVPDQASHRRGETIDPDRVQSQLTGLSRGLAAAARTPTPPQPR